MRKKNYIVKGKKVLCTVFCFCFLVLTCEAGQAGFYVVPVIRDSAPTPTPCANDGFEVLSETGQCWMAFNLGATQVATSMTDEAAYGDLYQWGRPADGHQRRADPITTTNNLSITDVPEHGDFITGIPEPHDWRLTKNNFLWQGASGINNPCPRGFRLPTSVEWLAEVNTYGNTAEELFNSPLRLTLGGTRFYDGQLGHVGDAGCYWSSDDISAPNAVANALCMSTEFSQIQYGADYRASGNSVRCIKDGTLAIP